MIDMLRFERKIILSRKRSHKIMKLLLPLVAILSGAVMALQGQINGGLGKKSVFLKPHLFHLE